MFALFRTFRDWKKYCILKIGNRKESGNYVPDCVAVFFSNLTTFNPFSFYFSEFVAEIKNSKEGNNPEKEYIDKTMN